MLILVPPELRQLRAIDVAGEGVLLSREGDGSLSAFSNVCRHRGHELAPIGEASPEVRTALMAIGVALFLVTMIVNVLARVIVWRLGQFTGDSAV